MTRGSGGVKNVIDKGCGVAALFFTFDLLERTGAQARPRPPRFFFSKYATIRKGIVRRHDVADRVAEISVDLCTLPPGGL